MYINVYKVFIHSIHAYKTCYCILLFPWSTGLETELYWEIQWTTGHAETYLQSLSSKCVKCQKKTTLPEMPTNAVWRGYLLNLQLLELHRYQGRKPDCQKLMIKVVQVWSHFLPSRFSGPTPTSLDCLRMQRVLHHCQTVWCCSLKY